MLDEQFLNSLNTTLGLSVRAGIVGQYLDVAVAGVQGERGAKFIVKFGSVV